MHASPTQTPTHPPTHPPHPLQDQQEETGLEEHKLCYFPEMLY